MSDSLKTVLKTMNNKYKFIFNNLCLKWHLQLFKNLSLTNYCLFNLY